MCYQLLYPIQLLHCCLPCDFVLIRWRKKRNRISWSQAAGMARLNWNLDSLFWSFRSTFSLVGDPLTDTLNFQFSVGECVMMMCFELTIFRYNVFACIFVKEMGQHCFFFVWIIIFVSQSYFHLFLVSLILFFLYLRVSILDLIITSTRIVWLKKNEYPNFYVTSFRDHLFSIFPSPRLNASPILKTSTIRHLTKFYWT